MTYNINPIKTFHKKIFVAPSSSANIGDQVLIDNVSYVVKKNNTKYLNLVKRVVDSNINNLTSTTYSTKAFDYVAEYSFLSATPDLTTDKTLINTSTFIEGHIRQNEKHINFYCVDVPSNNPVVSKKAFYYCKNPYLVIELDSKNFLLSFSDSKTWIELNNEDTSEVGDVIRSLKRDIFPVFDAGRWNRSQQNEIVNIDWSDYQFCVSTGSGNLHLLRPFDEKPCTCEDCQHRGFIFKCKHQISVERKCFNVFNKSLVEALADKLNQ